MDASIPDIRCFKSRWFQSQGQCDDIRTFKSMWFQSQGQCDEDNVKMGVNRKGGGENRTQKIAFSKFFLSTIIPAYVMQKWEATYLQVDKEVGDILKYAPNRRGGGGRN